MTGLRRHWLRIAITLLPVGVALLHVVGAWRLPFVASLDNFIYDARLRATMPRTADERIVIVDIDDPSLQQLGQWPWSRDKLARLTDELIVRQQVLALGFDVLFIEPDESAGLPVLRELGRGPLRGDPAFARELERLAPRLDHDATFAAALAGRPVALGYYFTHTAAPRARGVLPAPALPPQAFPAGRDYAVNWNGFGGSLPRLASAAPAAGFLNVMLDARRDGVVRAVPLLARYEGLHAAPGYYESLALTMHRLATGASSSPPTPLFTPDPVGGPPLLGALAIGSIGNGTHRLRVPVDQRADMLVPYRGPGGPAGGTFRYVAAADVLAGALPPGELAGRIVLVGASAPGLQDLRPTPVDGTFPGVEVHANILSALLDGRLLNVPDYAPGFELVMVAGAGLLLAFGLSLLSAPRAVLLGAGVVVGLVGFNLWIYLHAGLVLPLATVLVMAAVAFALNMSWGYFIETRASRSLAHLFGTYVPPQLVDEMRANPRRYSMRAQSKELTVMFCDMRGFTRLSEQMAPVDLQNFLNTIFSRLTDVISAHRGTIDKYMGDCVMAFWGAPVDTPDHAALAVAAAIDITAAVDDINRAQRAQGGPGVSVGIGLNTGVMSVGDMGSAVRRSYTVVGDAVNLASRLESLGEHYGVQIVASVATRDAALRTPARFAWQELDLVRVRGKAQAVRIFTPLSATARPGPNQLEHWDQVLAAYRAQEPARALALLAPLQAEDEQNYLYRLYAQRLASMLPAPKDPSWDGATHFETK